MFVRRQRATKKISLCNKKKENYENNTRDKTDSDPANNDKNLLQL